MVDIIDNKWNEADASNTNASPNGLQGGYAPSSIAPTIRQMMGAVKRSYVQNNAIYTTTGSASNYVLTYSVAPSALTKGIQYAFWANHTNTGPATLNINGLGAKAIITNAGAALAAGQIVTGTVVIVIYDGTSFRSQNLVENSPSFAGTVTANLFNGSGAGLTNLNASNLATGTVPNARLSGAYDGFTLSSADIAITGSTWSTTAAQTGGFKITGAAPNIQFRDTSGTLGAMAGVNSDQFYIYKSEVDGLLSAVVLQVPISGTGNMVFNGDIVWTKGNQGPGSTLDADTVDGIQGTSIVQITRTLTAGNGLSGGGTLGADRTFTLGTPGSITGSSTNAVTTTSHTHALVLTATDINDALGYNPASGARTVSAGNGLTGGGALSANPVITMGTPGSITNASTNAVSTSSHTHALGFTAAEVHTSGTMSTNMPIGTVLLYYSTSSTARNGTTPIRYHTTLDGAFTDTGSGSLMAGTYRNRGNQNDGINDWSLAQRMA